ncbi:hypothetical protein COV17_04600 [Candidatus Woesearchaeota archaeon CG10_big_fil_rev_8_21_14_0_10_36_11]|nr:MAG: hypothetical protein COV17_04600 [Candidatus Woesearchaeota archaeon CG10_big_fil_rev_8_21_14_0_10_36_11]
MFTFTYIQTKEELKDAVQEWNSETELAIDIECENNLHHYGAYVSIIQVSTRKKHWIIDVIECKDIDMFIKIIENKKILKIFHDVSFDIRILQYQFKCKVKNVYDTQMAALLLGKENVGLGSLLEKYFNIQKERKYQRVDWTKRPLTADMLAYAVKDTAYLFQLKEMLEHELRAKNRLSWIHQECNHFEDMDFSYREQTYRDISGVKSMTPKERALFHALFDERKKIAKLVDRPVFMIFTNKQMISFVKNPPYDIKSWKNLKGVHPVVRDQADHFASIVKEASTKEEELPDVKHKKLTPDQYENSKKVIECRNTVAKKQGIKGHLLLNNEQVIDIVVEKSMKGIRQWQKELVQDKINDILRKK